MKRVSKSKFTVIWDDAEKIRFKEIIKDIRKRSDSLAEYIKSEISDRIEKIKFHPELFEMDANKAENDGNYRKF